MPISTSFTAQSNLTQNHKGTVLDQCLTGGENYKNNNITIKPINSNVCGFSTNLGTYNTTHRLSISGANYYNKSGVYICSASNNLSMNIAWNENNSYSMTESYFNLSYESYFITGCFGIYHSQYLFIKSSDSLVKIEKLKQNVFYNISFQFIGNNVEMGVKNGNKTIYIGSFNAIQSTPRSNSLNLTLNGNYYNLTIKNICSNIKYKFISESKTPNTVKPKERINTGITFSSAANLSPIFQRSLNVYFLQQSKHKEILYNPVSNKSHILFQNLNYSIIEGISANNYSYWLLKSIFNSSYELLQLNNSNLQFSYENFIYNGRSLHIFLYQNSVIFSNSTELFNPLTHRIYLNFIKLTKQNYIFIGTEIVNKKIYSYLKERNNLTIINVSSKENYVYSNFTSFNTSNQTSGNIIAGISYSTKGSPYYYPVYSLFSPGTIVNIHKGQYSFLTNNTHFILYNSTSTQCYSYIGLFLNFNGNSFLTLNNNKLVIYEINVLPIQSLHVTLKKKYIIQKVGFLNFTFNYNLSYEVNINVANKTFSFKDSNESYVNLSSFQSGIYSFSLEITTELLNSYNYTSTLYVDNSSPYIEFNQNISYGVYGGEILTGTFYDNLGISHVTLKDFNISINYTLHTFILKIPILFGAKIVNLSFNVTDNFNISHKILIKIPFYEEKYNHFEEDLYNNEIFNTHRLNITYSGQFSNLSYIFFSITNTSTGKTFYVNYSGNPLNLTLANGVYGVETFALFKTTYEVKVDSLNITVDTIRPTVTTYGYKSMYYSFFGNSENNSFNFNFKSSENGDWIFELFHGSEMRMYKNQSGSNIWINSTGISELFTNNGTYTLYYSYTSLNHFLLEGKLILEVDNSVPIYYGPRTLYTNNSIIDLSHIFSNLTYRINIGNSKNIIINGSDINLTATGFYTLNITLLNNASNSYRLNLNIVYNQLKPNIMLEGWRNNISNNLNLTFNLSSSSKIPLIKEVVTLNGKVINETKGNYSVSFSRDGKYVLEIYAMNACGNSIQDRFYANVTYFSLVSNMSVNFHQFFNYFQGTLVLSGFSLNKATVQWYINGKIEGVSRSYSSYLNNGWNNVTVTVLYHGGVKREHIEVFSLSSYLLTPLPVIIAFLFLYSTFPINRDWNQLVEEILSSDDRLARDVIKTLRKKHYSRKKIWMALNLLIEKKMVQFSPDPENKIRIEVRENIKKK
jgi:hypothetical protein